MLLVIAPFGAIFGAIANQAGLNLIEAMAMSVIILAGASQIAALQLLSDQAPALIAILTGLFINLRFAMYSASLAPYWQGAPLWQRALCAYLMVDQSYGMSIRRYIESPDDSVAYRVSYYFGVSLPVVFVWFISTGVGAVLGAAIPPQLSLEFAVPVTFIAIVAPILRGLPNLAAAIVAVALALAFYHLPYNLGLLVAAAGGMGVGLSLEVYQEIRGRAVS
jgi:4-azaleucine resistance transporter AzlC